MRFAAGSLNRRVTLQTRADAIDPTTGDRTPAWANLIDVSAAVPPLSGRELIAADAPRASDTTEFTINYRRNIDTTMRVVWRGVAYDITDVQNVDAADEVLVLTGVTGLKDDR